MWRQMYGSGASESATVAVDVDVELKEGAAPERTRPWSGTSSGAD